MKWLTCVDEKGFDDVLEYGERYLVEPMAAQCVRVWVEGGGSIVCAADRFAPCLAQISGHTPEEQ